MRRHSGFTLLELVLVLVIGAALMALMVSMLPARGASSAELKAAARMLASGLRHAQTTAMTTRRDALLTVDLEAREYAIPNEPQARKLPEGVDLKLVTAQSEAISQRKGAIRFYPDGSSTGGRITVSAGKSEYRVDVDWLTGRVSIQ